MNRDEVAIDYMKAKNVYILLDFIGTLPQNQNYNYGENETVIRPSDKKMDILYQLS